MILEDPIEYLVQEHKQFMFELEKLRIAGALLGKQEDGAASGVLPALQEIANAMAARLVLHSRKEDELLYPAMEAAFGSSGGLPTSVMRDQHMTILKWSGFLSRTLQELIQVEHEAIEANSNGFVDLTASSNNAAELEQAIEETYQLLQSHFANEEAMVFPMARNVLDPEALRRLAERFGEIC